MSSPRVLYCGDTSLDSAACYLASLMTHWDWDFTYVSSDSSFPAGLNTDQFDLFIFSDYPARQIGEDDQQKVVDQVRAGSGLLMIGGWESFHGLGGNWDGTPVGDSLPVLISSSDDRRNCDCPVLVRPTTNHAITADLPWPSRPPLIGGFNQFQPKPDGQTILEAVLFDATTRENDRTIQFTPRETQPLLVVGTERHGRTTALATDVAPHWVGPMVDWGTSRVTAAADGTEGVEVGNDYESFFRSILGWTSGR